MKATFSAEEFRDHAFEVFCRYVDTSEVGRSELSALKDGLVDYIASVVARAPASKAGPPTLSEFLDEPQQAALLTPVAGGHVFRGTWEALAELDTATCEACGEHIKQDGELAEVVEHDGAGVAHRIMCDGWSPSAPSGALLSLARGMTRERVASYDEVDLLPSRPSHDATAELYSAHWDASRTAMDDPHADARASLFRIGKAFDALTAALSDEEHALRMAMEHDERGLCGADCAPPEALAEELTDARLAVVDIRARGALEMASKATAGPWEANHGYNNGGCPTAFFKIPAHNQGGEVEMLADDAFLCAAAREDVPALAAAVLALSAEVRRLRAEQAATAKVLAGANQALRGLVSSQERTIARAAETLVAMGIESPALASGEPPRAGEEGGDG